MSERQTKPGNQECFAKLAKLANWSLGHAEQLLFSCLCSKVTIYRWKWQWVFLDSQCTLFCEFRVHWAGSQLKNVWMSDKSWEPDLTLTVSHSLTLVILNNVCFHVYAQKSLSHSHTLKLSHSLNVSHSHSLIHSIFTCWTTFVFMSMQKSHPHTLALSHYLTISFIYSRYAEQLLFSCLCSNVTLYRWKCQWFFLTPTPSPVTLDVIELVPS